MREKGANGRNSYLQASRLQALHRGGHTRQSDALGFGEDTMYVPLAIAERLLLELTDRLS